MTRQARITCSNKIYHTILRGVNKQQIFECSEDYEHFVHILQRMCGLPVETRPTRINHNYTLTECEPILQVESSDEVKRHCFIYAWCLMGNHVHLLVREADEPIGDTMKRISSSYVYYYNRKYNRVGHLFQERFKSQPVENWNYFLTLLRYIHQNPLKPQLVKDLKDYRWSSWNEYLGNYAMPFTSTKTVLDKIPLQELSDLVIKPMSDDEVKCLIDVDVCAKDGEYSDNKIWKLIERLAGAKNVSEFQSLPRPMQKHYLYMMHEEGIGPRVLSRLTGVPYSIVQRATSARNERFVREQHDQRQSMSMLCESNETDELWLTYCDDDEFEKYPEY